MARLPKTAQLSFHHSIQLDCSSCFKLYMDFMGFDVIERYHRHQLKYHTDITAGIMLHNYPQFSKLSLSPFLPQVQVETSSARVAARSFVRRVSMQEKERQCNTCQTLQQEISKDIKRYQKPRVKRCKECENGCKT